MNVPIIHIALLLLLLALSGFFSGSETAIFSLEPLTRRKMRGRGRLANLALRLSHEKRQTLRTILLGNLVINLLYFSASTTLALRITRGLGTASASARAAGVGIISLALIILFGEVLPKLLAVNFPRGFASAGALPIHLLHCILRPLWVRTDSFFDRLAGILRFGSRHVRRLDTDELQELVELSARKGIITHVESSLIAEAVALADLKVSEVMVPRVDVTCFDAESPIEELRELIRETRRNKIPVYRGTRDNVIGIIPGRDALLDVSGKLDEMMRPPQFVPELASIGAVFEQITGEPNHVAIAIDEYGGFAGIITLEDIIEEVVGEIEDEHEQAGPLVEQLSPGRYRVSGALNLRDWGELFGVEADFPGLDTVGGLVMLLLGRIPCKGDRVEFAGLALLVEKLKRRTVDYLIVELDAQGRAQAAN